MRLIVVAIIILLSSCTSDSSLNVAVSKISLNNDEASISEFIFNGKSSTILNLHFSDFKCMIQPLEIEGINHTIEINWISKTTLIVRLPRGLKYTNNTDDGYVMCEEYKIQILIEEIEEA